MFTGIVQELGALRERVPAGAALRLLFRAPLIAPGLKPGDSVAVDGVCLTAEQVASDGFSASAVPETLARTTLGKLHPGDAVNLEPALKAGSPLGGHFLQGHIDGMAEVVESKDLGEAGRELWIRVPGSYLRYCVEKGSFALQGASLTIARLDEDKLCFALVPHTLAHTTLGRAAAGQRLNFEVDLLGKYVEKLLEKSLHGL